MSTVDVWVATGADPVDEGCLSTAEHVRAAAMAAPTAAARHRRGRALLRHAVAHRTGLDPATIPMATTLAGRPVVDGPDDIHVSLSHAGDAVAVAVATSPVGIDVEVHGTRQRPVPAAVRTPPRLAAVAHLADEARAPLVVWVALEAALKAAGTGFSQPWRAARLGAANDGVLVDLVEGGRHGVRLLARPDGIIVAVAARDVVPVVRLHGAARQAAVPAPR